MCWTYVLCRPNKDTTGEVSESGASVVKHALNPGKPFMQVHYLKVSLLKGAEYLKAFGVCKISGTVLDLSYDRFSQCGSTVQLLLVVDIWTLVLSFVLI